MNNMPRIQDYSFGKMVIAGKNYSSDLVILPSGSILSPWIRQSGHLLVLDDMPELLETDVTHIIIGTGASGRMQMDPTLLSHFKDTNIIVDCHPSPQAPDIYNKTVDAGIRLGACFHLTC